MKLLAALQTLLERGDAFAWVAVAIIGLFGLVMLSALGLFFHHTRSALRRQTLRKRMGTATDLLAPTVGHPERLSEAMVQSTRAVGPRATAAVLREMRVRITGDFARTLSRHLEELGEVDRLGQLGTARRSWLRRAAARGLGECGGDLARGYLVSMLKDPDPEVRRTARGGLLSREDPVGIAHAIESYLSDAVMHKGWKAAFYARLASVAPAELRGLLTSGKISGFEEKLALEALGDVQVPSEVPHIAELAGARLRSKDPELRASAVRVAGRLRLEQFRPLILEDLRDPVWFVRAGAARALETLGADASVDEALAGCLTDKDWWVRANAAKTLARRGGAGHARLNAALESDDVYARDAALSALTSAGALPSLGERLKSLHARYPDDVVIAALLRRSEVASV
jgi:HEAT repeat protein